MAPPSSSSPDVWFIAGPPVEHGLFAEVRRRLGFGVEVPLLDADAPGGWRERAEALSARVARAPRPVVAVAHGLALPAVFGARGFDAVLVMDGPVTRLDPVSAALARLAATSPRLLANLARPGPWIGWLASSAGLRRAVVNPYAMDRDTVGALAMSRVETAAGRNALVRYLASLVGDLPDPASCGVPVGACWGDADALYPASEMDFLAARLPGCFVRVVPGGRLMHPVEQPWAVADVVAEFLSETSRSASGATSVSGSAVTGPSRRHG